MGDWYWIGLLAGLGTGLGVLSAGLLGWMGAGIAAALAAAVAAGLGAGFAIGEWDEAASGALGGLLGAASTLSLARGALKSGGTETGTALLLAGAAVVASTLSLIPGVGYLEAVAAPLLGAGLRLRRPKRFAGLRTLAR
jgi:hypothetical protein